MRQNSKGLNKSNYFGAILQSLVTFKLSKTRTDPGSGAAIYAYWIETRYKKTFGSDKIRHGSMCDIPEGAKGLGVFLFVVVPAEAEVLVLCRSSAHDVVVLRQGQAGGSYGRWGGPGYNRERQWCGSRYA